MARAILAGLLAATVVVGGILGAPRSAPAQQADAPPVVFAAASLKDALDAVARQWHTQSGKSVRISYAASSVLAKQIEQGAPAALFVSADLDWMDYLEQRKLIRSETRTNLLSNRIVLVVGKPDPDPIDLAPGVDLSARLKGGRLAIANVETVPAGKYGKAALEKLGAWSSVAARLAQAENVRAALLLVSRGEAPLGIVYATDAAADPGVVVVATFPADTHPPIIYPAALTTQSGTPDAAAFLDHMTSAAARRIFEQQGFTIAGSGRS